MPSGAVAFPAKITITCKSCKVPLEGPETPDEGSIITCPSCGVKRRFGDLIKIHEKEIARQIMTAALIA